MAHPPGLVAARPTLALLQRVRSHGPLAYHFSGDVLAAALQTLSFDTIHASLALSLAHDVLFGLLGTCLALLATSFGQRRAITILLSELAVLLTGPMSALRGEPGLPQQGYSFLSFYHMSFRPHVALAALLLVGMLGAAFVRLVPEDGESIAPGSTLAPLFGCTALLGITDEVSGVIFIASLGLAWVVRPHVILRSRRAGALALVGLGAALLAPNLAFGGALSPGGPRSASRGPSPAHRATTSRRCRCPPPPASRPSCSTAYRSWSWRSRSRFLPPGGTGGGPSARASCWPARSCCRSRC